MQLDHLRTLRRAELAMIRDLLPANSHVLEIGAGAGWQAREMTRDGHLVAAVDVEPRDDDPAYSQARVWPVIRYDGYHLPFADGTFDIVFSSNVLEHVGRLQTLQREMARVVRPGGQAIHIVPSSSWRWWSIVSFYPGLLRLLVSRLIPGTRRSRSTSSGRNPGCRRGVGRAGWLQRWMHAARLRRHGETGTAWSEIYTFSRHAWKRRLTAGGWTIQEHRTNHLCYTGDSLFGSALGLDTRSRLSRLLGSSCHVFVVRPPAPAVAISTPALQDSSRPW